MKKLKKYRIPKDLGFVTTKPVPRRGGYMIARVVNQPGFRWVTRSNNEMDFYRAHKIKGIKRRYKVATRDSYTVEIPILMTTIPEVPDAIYVGKHVFVKTNDAPLTYHWVSIWRARKVNTR